MKRTIFMLLCLLGIVACGGQGSTNAVTGCPNAFDKSATVFDTVLICATSGVTQDKLNHAANVTAEWLDNDEDGQVDEPRLLDTLKANKPTLVMSNGDLSGLKMARVFVSLGDVKSQDLGAAETNPSNGRRDASQEEIHHLIMNAGWQSLFPDIFSETDTNSTLYQAWKFADENQYYVYNDPTCNASCKVTEFVYLATAAYFGGDIQDLQTDEIRLYTRDELQETIPAMVEIFESTDYAYPTNHWPDGTYAHPGKISFTGDTNE